MDNMATIRLELGIQAQQIASHIQVRNKQLESEIEKEIEMAMNEILEGDSFAIKIKHSTKDTIEQIVHKAIMGWEIQNKITKLVQEKVGEKIEAYAEQLATKIAETLK